MIDISLADQLPDFKTFKTLDSSDYPCLFLGFIINSEYDNQRMHIDEKYNPIKIVHQIDPDVFVAAFYGIRLTPNDVVKNLINTIVSQRQKGVLTKAVYENILNQYNMSCKHTYLLMRDSIYPIDFVNLKSVCIDSFNNDKKIFQHLLSIDEKVFDFQKFAALKLFVLTGNNSVNNP